MPINPAKPESRSAAINIQELSKSLIADSKPGFDLFRTNLPENVATGSMLGAAFTNDNSLVSLGQKISLVNSLGSVVTPGFDPVPHIWPGYEQYTDEFLTAQSLDDMFKLKNNIDRQQNAKQLLANNPVRGFFAGIPANLFDPTTLLPGGLLWREAKLARSAFGSAARVAAGAAVSTAVQETALSNTQLTRDFEESFWNMISASALGGVFGGIGGKVLGGPSGSRSIKEITKILSGEEHGPVPEGHHYSSMPKASKEDIGIGPEAQKQIIDGEFTEVKDPDVIQAEKIEDAKEIATFGGPSPVGADVVSPDQLKQSESLWRIQPFVDKFPQFTPTLRLLKSPYGASRRLANLLSETMFITNKNFEGGTNANIETRIKQRMQTFVPDMVMIINDGFLAQKGVETRVPLVRDVAARASKEGLNRTDYNVELSRALRNNGASENASVESVANKIINRIMNPLRDEAIELGMLPEGVTPETALGYLTKIRNIPGIIEDMALDASKGGKQYQNIVYNAFNNINNQLISLEPQIKTMRKSISDVTKTEKAQIKKQQLLDKLEKTKKSDRSVVELQIKAAKKELDVFVKEEVLTVKEKSKELLSRINKKEELAEKERLSLESIKSTFDVGMASAVAKFEKTIEKLRKNKTPGILNERKKHSAEKAKLNKQFRKDSVRLKSKIKSLNKDVRFLKTKQKELQAKDIQISNEKIIRKTKDIKDLEAKLKQTINKIDELKKDLEKNPVEALTKQVEALEKQLDDSVPRKLKRRLKNGKLEIRNIQDQDSLHLEVGNTIERLIGTNEDRFESPLFSDLKGGSTNPDVFHERVLMIDDHVEEAFLVNDPELLLSYMIRAMVPTIEFKKMAKQMNFESIAELRSSLLNEITSELNTKIERGSIKDAEKAREIMNRDISDVEALIDINMGVYGNGFNTFSNASKDFWKNLRDWNFSRMGGFMGMASIMEPLSHGLKTGPFKMLAKGMLPAIKSLVGNIQSLPEKTQISLLRSLGYGLQSEMGSVAKSMLDGGGLGVRKSIYRRVFSTLSDVTAELNMLKKIQDISENITGRIVISQMLEDIDLWKQGKISEKADVRLNALGINKEARAWLHKQWQDVGGIDEGAYWIDHTAIENIHGRSIEHYNVFRDAIVKDIDTSVVKSGAADKPLFAHSETGKTLFQFKNWSMGATNRLALAGFQRSDIEFYTGTSFMLFGGVMSYITTMMLRNQEIDWSFDNLALEAIDRSGLFGVYMEGVNILGKGLFGTGPSRYQSRTLAGAFLGPSVGMPDELLKLFNKIYRSSIPDGDPLKTRDLQAAQRLVPLQNMWFMYLGNRAITDKIGMGLGLED